jgi:hypothetical protein
MARTPPMDTPPPTEWEKERREQKLLGEELEKTVLKAKLDAIAKRKDIPKLDRERFVKNAALHNKPVSELAQEISWALSRALRQISEARDCVEVLMRRYEHVLSDDAFNNLDLLNYFEPIYSVLTQGHGLNQLEWSGARLLNDVARMLSAKLIGLGLTIYFDQIHFMEAELEYKGKSEIVADINSQLRKLDLAFAHPETGEACILYAVTSRDGMGRYSLENRITKTRTGGFKSIRKLMPFQLTTDIPRKEGVIERRKNKDD